MDAETKKFQSVFERSKAYYKNQIQVLHLFNKSIQIYTIFKGQIESQQTLKDFNKHLQQSLENAKENAEKNAKEYDRSKQAWQQSLDEERSSNQALKKEIDDLKQKIQILSAQNEGFKLIFG